MTRSHSPLRAEYAVLSRRAPLRVPSQYPERSNSMTSKAYFLNASKAVCITTALRFKLSE